MKSAHKLAFTLVEALVAAVLLGVGATAAVGALGSLSRLDFRAREHEEMQRLALQKFGELSAKGSPSAGSIQGDFKEVGEARYVWRATRAPAGGDVLDSLTVEVGRVGEDLSHAEQAVGLLARAPGVKR